ncbi:penicillin-binding transpeptidase domain-containing protein [Paenibacillus sp. WLX2291]|uniref:penicillin-binding transpeptidase domain-containing protein n=1 Tax=Paenibacillus sp. WLX2291 TaxID=3296934 RepID=UPI00398423B1
MNKRIRLRTLLMGGCIALLFVVLVLRIFWLQIVQGSSWHERAVENWTQNSVIKAARGTITDRNGNEMAIDAPAYNVALNPQIIDKYGIKDEIVSGLHEILGTDEAEIEKQATSKNDQGELRTWRELNTGGHLIAQDKADQVNALITKLKQQIDQKYDAGLYLTESSKRYYPQNELASHVLGYTDKEGKAVAGIEAYYDEQLKGSDGKIQYQHDRQGDKLPDSDDVYTPAQNGDNLKLTIDQTIQYYTEQAMKKQYAELKPKSITAIVADPNTMNILAMANMPTFDPNKYNEVPADQYSDFMNLGIKGIYEPGSTFKIVTLTGAVKENLFNADATYQSGSIRVGGWTLHDSHTGWGAITYLSGLKRSSNVAFVKLGYEMLGAERLRKYIDAFGFGVKTGVDLPGEASGAINFNPNIKVEVATAAYGHGKVQVTPLQQLAAVSAVANGGKLLTPHLVQSITNPNTGVTTDTPVHEVRQVIDSATAAKVRSYLEQVVSDQEIGTGRQAYIEGYRVAGKTGTAIKVKTDGSGGYDKNKQVSSFIGFAPANDPKIAVIVVVDEPADPLYGGGKAAAPIFKEIVSQALPYMGVAKVAEDGATTQKKTAKVQPVQVAYTAPTLTGKGLDEAKKKLLAGGIAYTVVGSGTKIVKQYPAAGAPLVSGQSIYLMTEDPTKMAIPDLKGESLRDAMQLLNLMKVQVTTVGTGYVAEQVESEGNGRRIVTLTLKSAKATVTGVDDPEENATGSDGKPTDDTANSNTDTSNKESDDSSSSSTSTDDSSSSTTEKSNSATTQKEDNPETSEEEEASTN